MSEEETIITGYWNGDSEDWVLTKESSSDKDLLVVISVEVVPDTKKDGDATLRDFKRSVNKVSRELRGFVRDLKKIR